MTALTDMLHESFVSFARRHSVILDAWEVREKRNIESLAEKHHRSLGQLVRRIRIQLLAASSLMPTEGDPDFFPILQAKRALDQQLDGFASRAALRREEILRLVGDQPFMLKE